MSGTGAVNYTANMPMPSLPMVDPTSGLISPAWFQWFLSIFARTGSANGIGTAGVQAEAAAALSIANVATAGLTAETAARIAADAALAPKASPALTGTPTAPTVTPTATAGTTQLATTAFVRTGTTTNDNALAGQVGQFLFSEIAPAAGVALTTGIAANVTSISLEAGDWDITGSVVFTPAATTAMQTLSAWSSSTSATVPVGSIAGYNSLAVTFPVNIFQVLLLPMHRFTLRGTTSVFLSALATFTTSTLKASGYIEARRMR